MQVNSMRPLYLFSNLAICCLMLSRGPHCLWRDSEQFKLKPDYKPAPSLRANDIFQCCLERYLFH